jgi:hypothetical protein
VAPEAVVVVLEIVGFLAPPPVVLAFIPILGTVTDKTASPATDPVISWTGSHPAFVTLKVAIPVMAVDPVKLKSVELYSKFTLFIVAETVAALLALAAAIGI